jgi:hypothetical protein
LTNKLTKELNQIKSRLVNLQLEDDKAAEEIRADLFTLVKVTESFEEYLHKINNQKFTSQEFIFNSGHESKREKFNVAREFLLGIVNQILREVKYGALKPKLLPAPETVSFIWLFKHGSLSFWASVFFAFLFIFGVGGVVEKKYGNVSTILKVALHPTEQLESKINEK